MKKEYLSEAFRQLELLNEEDFNLSTTADNSDLKDFLDNDDMSVMSLDVIDPEAETEEDLEDSYTGKVILDCCVCHSKLYKDKEEVQIDEEQDLANTDEECPFCYSRDGFKIIGEVAPYGETEAEPEVEEEPEDIEHEENKEDMDEGFKTELIPNNGRKSFYGKAVVDTLDDGSQVLYSYNTPIIKKYPNGELKRLYDGWSATTGAHIKTFCGLDKKGFLNLEYEQFNESLKTRKNRKLKESMDTYNDIVDSLAEYASEYLEEEPDRDVYECIAEVINSNFIYYDDQYTVLRYLGENPLEYCTDTMWEEFYNDIASKVEVPEKDDETNESLKTDKNKRLKESVKNGYRGSKDIEYVWKGPWSDPELVYDGKTFNYWDIEDALWNMFLEENPQWTDDDSDNPECEDEFNRYVQYNGALYLDDVIAGGYFDEPSEKNESVNESEDGRKLFTEYKILVDGRTYEISHTKQRADEIVPILKDMYPDSEIEAKPYKHYASGIERKRLERQIADQLKEYGVNESVNESIQEIEIETDTDKIKIESEPKEESGETEDILAPVSPETEQQIENNSSDEIDVPIDEFDEDTFDELGESFLKNTYENVKGYKTESVKEQDDNKLVVEGLITFNSGKVKKTSFIFEAKDITKSGKVRFIGENCQLSRGKKSFTVAGKVQEGKFISESLNYNYRAKDAKSGKSTRMYGTVRTNK